MGHAALLDAYLGGPDRLRSAVTGLSREQLISRPITGKWSVLEVVCHLVDTDANIAHRIKRVLSEERPVFDRVKPELILAALAYHDRDVEDAPRQVEDAQLLLDIAVVVREGRQHQVGLYPIEDRPLLGEYPLEPMDDVGVGVGQVRDDLQDAPSPGDGPRDQLLAAQARDGRTELFWSRKICVEQGGVIHRILP